MNNPKPPLAGILAIIIAAQLLVLVLWVLS